MAKDFGGNDDSYELFYPHKLKLKIQDNFVNGRPNVIELVYDGKVLDSVSLQNWSQCSHDMVLD